MFKLFNARFIQLFLFDCDDIHDFDEQLQNLNFVQKKKKIKLTI